MYSNYNSTFNFITIYISEAHASDEWPLRTKKSLLIKQHKTNLDRINVAKGFVNEYGFKLPMYVDTISNDFERTYSAWPLRAFVILKNKIIWHLKPKNPGYFDLKDILLFVKSFKNQYNKCQLL
mmetsp:Transcript_50184/g.61567  ORF Transcript_50184/g.61567 Transcript_50184/m.61567 type:complete len:124 (-) Transcript_50184:64-435(-)